MSFSPNPAIVELVLESGIPYTINFSYSDPTYTISSADLPAGLTLVPVVPGNTWLVIGTPHTEFPIVNTSFVFTLTKPNSPSVIGTYTVTLIASRNNFACAGSQSGGADFMFIIEFPCARTRNDTLAGNLIGDNSSQNFDLRLEVRNAPSVGVQIFVFTPFNGTNGLFLTITFQNEIIVGLDYMNVTQTQTAPGFVFSFKLNGSDVYYDFGIQELPFRSIPTQIRGRISSPVPGIREDDISNGPNDNQPIPIENCDLNEIPRIIITSILMDTRLENNSEYNFSIIDTVKYKGYFCDSTRACPTKKIYRTDFTKYPQIQTVIKGNVCNDCGSKTRGTLNQKIQFLIEKFNITQTFKDFYMSVSFYAAARYVLSGFLYGKFSVKFLLEKYYKQFLQDLRNSRFFRFAVLFEDPQFGFVDYFRFFLFDVVKSNDECECECDFKHNNYKQICDGNTNGCKTIIRSRVL